MKTLPLIVLGLLIAAQFAVPFKMIHGRETILREGEVFRFRTRPIDPADPFQGRYVRLGIQNDYVPRTEETESELKRKMTVYAVVETDEDGFARFTRLTRERPESGYYLKTRYRGPRRVWNEKTKKQRFIGDRIDIPFDRFYMDEAKAPEAERLTRAATRTTNCWAEVRILDGKAVIEDVLGGGMSLRSVTAAE